MSIFKCIISNTGNTIWNTGTYTQGGKAEGSILKTNKGVSIITVPVSDPNASEQNKDAAVAEFAKASLIKQLLPILDNIDRASAADKSGEDYLKGIELIAEKPNT